MKKILVVEDEIAYAKLLVSQLTAKGYTVLQATDGNVGLALAKKENPDLILLDIRMPGMDGMTMLRLLRQEEGMKHTNVIMLTNLEPDDTIINNVVHDVAEYYFVKSDTTLNELLSKIKELLTR